jgi:hypothetical protein
MLALLKFDTLRAAVKVTVVFDSKFLSNKQNMIFVKNSFQLDSSSISSSKATSGNSNNSSSSTKLRKETVFIYFELKKLVKSQK